MQPFKLITRTKTLSVYRCPNCHNEFATESRSPKCSKCHYPNEGSEFNLAIKRAKSEIHSLIKSQGFIRRRTELQPIIDTLKSEFPKVQLVDIFGGLEFSLKDERIRNEVYDLELHEYVDPENLKTIMVKRPVTQAFSDEATTGDPIILLLEKMERKRKERTYRDSEVR